MNEGKPNDPRCVYWNDDGTCMCGEYFEHLNKFDLVWESNNSRIYLLLTDLIDIPHYEDGCGSGFSEKPLDLTDPNEWKQTFRGWIAWNTYKQDYEIISALHNFKKIDLTNGGYIPFDQGTSMLRGVLGLIKLGRDSWEKEKQKSSDQISLNTKEEK